MKRLLPWIMPLFGLAVFAVVVRRAGPARIAAVLSSADPALVVWAPVLVAAIALARGLRWRYVAGSVGIPYGLWRATQVWMIGFFASSVTPAKSGDALRAIYLRNDTGRPLGECFLTVFVDRLWDLGFVLCAGVASAVIFSHRYIAIPSAPLFIAAAAAVALAAAAMTHRGAMRALLKPMVSLLVPPRHHDDLSASFHNFYDALRQYGTGKRRTLVMAALTLGGWVLIFLLAVYVARVLSIPVDPAFLVLIMPIVTLVELIPFTVSGLGTRDATVVYFFSVVGVGSAEAVGFSIAYVLLGTYLTALIGLALWIRYPMRRRATMESS
jgi:glycosyltransferase 2 family protein